MTVQIPQTDKSGLVAKAAEITVLSARTDNYSVQRLNAAQIELVNALLAQSKLVAATILSTVSFKGANPLAAAITAANVLVTKYGATPPGYAATQTVDLLQRQACEEMMISGQMPASLVLSTMTYMGG